MIAWIQTSDFESTEFPNVSASEALKLFSKFDWSSELLKQQTSSTESCDPGFGLISETDSILHICPSNNSTCYINYHYSIKTKILGLFPKTISKTHHINTISLLGVEKLIEYHYSNSIDKILEIK